MNKPEEDVRPLTGIVFAHVGLVVNVRVGDILRFLFCQVQI